MVAEKRFLPYGRQIIDEDDIAAVADVLRGDFLTTGPNVEKFEAVLADHTGARFAVVCSSGTAALHLATMALHLSPGDIGIVPSITFLATANCLRYVGADVLFADVDPHSGLLTAETFEAALARAPKKPKVVLPVHINGQAADMTAIAAIARREGIETIEDACHAIGGSAINRNGEITAIGKTEGRGMAVFSFHPVKTIAMGEGGAITTEDPELDHRLRTLRNIGMVRDPGAFRNTDMAFDRHGDPNPWYYEMHGLGYNLRASDIHCALGVSQFRKLGKFVAARRERVDWYRQALPRLGSLVKALPQMRGCEPAWHLFVVQIDFAAAGTDRATVMNKLKTMGVGTQVHYVPVHRQPYYRELYGDLDLPGADHYYERALSLPLFPAMTRDDVNFVVDCLGQVLGAGA